MRTSGGEDERSSPSVSHCLQLVLVVAIFIIISRNSIAPRLDKEIQIYLLLLNIRNLCDNIVCYVSNPVGKHRVAVISVARTRDIGSYCAKTTARRLSSVGILETESQGLVIRLDIWSDRQSWSRLSKERVRAGVFFSSFVFSARARSKVFVEKITVIALLFLF